MENECGVTYTRLNGRVIDLSVLAPEDGTFLLDAYQRASCPDTDPFTFGAWIISRENPLLARSMERPGLLVEHPLMVALWDLEMRLNIALGRWGRGDLPKIDNPFADTFITIAEAAKERGVSVPAIHRAAERGDIVVTHDRPAMVSVRSLSVWRVDDGKRLAGLEGGRPRRRLAPPGVLRT